MNKFKVQFQSTKRNGDGSLEVIENRWIQAKSPQHAVKIFEHSVEGIKALNGGNWELKSVTNS